MAGRSRSLIRRPTGVCCRRRSLLSHTRTSEERSLRTTAGRRTREDAKQIGGGGGGGSRANCVASVNVVVLRLRLLLLRLLASSSRAPLCSTLAPRTVGDGKARHAPQPLRSTARNRITYGDPATGPRVGPYRRCMNPAGWRGAATAAVCTTVTARRPGRIIA